MIAFWLILAGAAIVTSNPWMAGVVVVGVVVWERSHGYPGGNR